MEGQRVAGPGQGGGRRKIWIALGGAGAAVLAGAYLGLCAWVGKMDTIFPNTSVAGLDVSGMTQTQAQAALEQAVAGHGDEMVGVVTYGGWQEGITAAQMDYDWSLPVQDAYEAGRESFLAQGGRYLARILGGRHGVSAPRGGEQPALERLLDDVEREMGGNVTYATYQLEGGRLTMTKGRTGVGLNRDEVRDSALSALEEAMERKLGGGQEGVVEVQRQLVPDETGPQTPDFEEIYRQLHTEPVSAQMDPETFTVTDHVVGVDFDVQALKAAYDQAAEGASFSIPVELEQPEETKESLESKLFADLLGQGQTILTGTWGRQYNVKLAAEACNGTILLPGEVFSFNGRTGSRDASMGYQSATVYSGGKTVEEVGGGVCQTSSTIYYALLHTNLEVVERYNHGYNTGYVPVGMDATVYYGVTDFQFRNSTDYPVKILLYPQQQGAQEALVCQIYGTNEEGVYAVPRSVSYDKVAPTTVYQPDETIPRGTTKVDMVQNPYTGLKAHTYRDVYDREGNLIEEQDMGQSVYKMRPKTILYNPADGDPATWVDGQPPQPGQPTGPEQAAGPGSGETSVPEEPVDPGTAGDPAPPTGLEQPEDPGQTGGAGTDVDSGTQDGSGQESGSGEQPEQPAPGGEESGGQPEVVPGWDRPI